MLLPAAPRDGLSSAHLTNVIHDTVDALELQAFDARYEDGGSRNQPFLPVKMGKVRFTNDPSAELLPHRLLVVHADLDLAQQAVIGHDTISRQDLQRNHAGAA